jgi:FAD/FMN-containing dehydrogenase
LKAIFLPEEYPRSVPLTRKRRLLLSAVLVVASLVLLGARKIFDYAAAPDKEKESDFVFPSNPNQEKPTVLLTEPQPPPFRFEQRGGFVNDASHLNKTSVYGVVRIGSEDDIRNALQYGRDHNLKITCAGQRHSMGGQTFTNGGIVLDLRDFNRIRLDKEHKTVNLQSGVLWWQLQKLLDKEGLSVKSMQSINIFSVGGTLSVNAHGIDPMPGPIAPTVRSLRVMLSDGRIVQASPTQNTDLFRHVLGGYGLFGVILDVDLDIVDNQDVRPENGLHELHGFSKVLRDECREKRGSGFDLWTPFGCATIFSSRDSCPHIH